MKHNLETYPEFTGDVQCNICKRKDDWRHDFEAELRSRGKFSRMIEIEEILG